MPWDSTNSIARARVLISAAMAAAKLLELEARLAILEAAVGVGRQPPTIDELFPDEVA